MKLKIPFSKYAGSGNDFIFIDNRNLFLPKEIRGLVSHLCHRKLGIGADGVISVENSISSDFKMKIFNADGGEAEMCGNGARCLFKFLHEIDKKKKAYCIETMNHAIALRSEQDSICVSMPEPYDDRWNIELNIDSYPLICHYINTGVPHAVIFVTDIRDPFWMAKAPKIRYHPLFQPSGVNVNFVELDVQGRIYTRTYERGVESETSACGTGAAAVGLVIAKLYEKAPPIQVIPASAEKLKINFTMKGDRFTHVELYGPVQFLFKGEFQTI